ncbi:MAG: carbamoyl-phosphate synthase domain-containing protein [Bacillota bacterium]|nr:carbamoyl-phosphate synthase domain-containing protein [Bacillota bacterium]
MRGALVLEDGSVFPGDVFGRGRPEADGREVVCASGLSWQSLVSWPSFAGQIVVGVGSPASTPQTAAERCYPSGLVLNGVDVQPLHEHAWQASVAGLTGVDTEALAEHLRRTGPLAGAIVPAGTEPGLPARRLAAMSSHPAPPDVGPEQVSTERPYRIYGGGPRVVVYDYGLGPDILGGLVALDCKITVVPWDHPAEAVLEMLPDAVVLSGGPGNPAGGDDVISVFRPLLGELPMLGVGLGHQLLARAMGARTSLMWCGHRGRGFGVRDLETGEVFRTTQSHGYCVLGPPPGARVTHTALNDATIEGLEYPGIGAFSVQFHPGNPGTPATAVWDRLLSPSRAAMRTA